MKRKIKLSTSKTIKHTAIGICWMVQAVVSLYDTTVFKILSAIGALAILALCCEMFLKTEDEDEMSRHNMLKAQAEALRLIKILVLVILMIVSALGILKEFFPFIIDDVKFSVSFVVKMMLGIMEVLTGILFVKYERKGD